MSTAQPVFEVMPADWLRDRAALEHIRVSVFVVEQGVPGELEWDEFDTVSLHVLAFVRGDPVGTGRLLPDGHIGRMAVLKSWRGRGVGSALLERLTALARERGDAVATLHAQTHALGFYARFGFVARGEEFIEAGIPHRVMTLTLRG